MTNITILGFIASALVVVGFAPQVWQTFKTKDTHSISLPTYSILSLASIMWAVYGLLIGDPPLIITNVIVCSMQISILYMKVKNG